MIGAVIQARMGSSRMPGKIFYKVGEKSFLELMIDRVKKSTYLSRIIVATSQEKKDDVVEQFCREKGIDCFRGSELDVIDRYYQCAQVYRIDTVVRLTADCPLVDPQIVDATIQLFRSGSYDYASVNTPPESRKFPDGCDVEVFSFAALKKAHETVTDCLFREHLTFQFWKDKSYQMIQMKSHEDYSLYRITVDYPEDAQVVGFIFEELVRQGKFGHLDEIIEILNVNKDIFKLNACHSFGEGWKR